MRLQILLAALLLPFLLLAQAPQAFDFQGVARDASGNVMSSQGITLRISILVGSPGGDVAYQETHSVTTSPFGLFTIQVGNGTPTQSTFPSIGWGASSHFIQVELDASGGSDFQDMGTTQLLSVPYALHARATDCFTVSLLGDTLHQGNGCHVIIPGISAANGGCLDLDGDGFYDRPGCGPVDCDDNDPTVYPGAPEICGNGVDNDCDGIVDNNPDPGAHVTWYLDADGDGFGDENTAVLACAAPGPNYVLEAGDCDDTDPGVYPGLGCGDLCTQTEIAWIDQNQAFYLPWYIDLLGQYPIDQAGFEQALMDAQTDATVPLSLDCHDCAQAYADCYVYQCGLGSCIQLFGGPVDTQACYDCLQQNGCYQAFLACVGLNLGDTDGDGWSAGSDCDNTNPAVNPGHPEICDGIDNNCNGLVDFDDPSLVGGFTYYPDNDGDGYGDSSAPLQSCDPEPPPGYVLDGGDCDDTDPNINPEAPDICDGIDNNCDGLIDGGFDLENDPSNCGDCGIECPPDFTCENGTCVCPVPGTQCDDGDPCTIGVWVNCTCEIMLVECPPGETCIDGNCELVCPSGQTNCGGACVDLQTSDQHCGDCGVPCPPDFTCENGTCICPVNGTQCDDGDPCTIGVWVNCTCEIMLVDCPPGEFCFNGACIADTDTDGDGVPDAIECPDFPNCPDTDGDGTPDYLDIDDDGDGVRTMFELGSGYSQGQGARDTDGDGIPDYLDPDDDGDGIPTFAELGGSYNPATNTGALNVDGDSKPDYLDPDDDGDGVPTNVECPVWPNCPDTDNDGIPDQRDNDDDGDGVRTAFELGSGYFQGQGPRDTDMDGVPDYLDPDDDGDGVLSKFELGGSYNPQTNTGIRDTDGDGIPNYLDIDDDGDGVFTLFELGGSYNPNTNTGLVDSDGDSEPNYLDADDDGDGIPTQFELGPSYDAATNTGALNTDMDVEDLLGIANVPNYLDDDDDGDGVPTSVECPMWPGCPDSNGNGIPDYLDASWPE